MFIKILIFIIFFGIYNKLIKNKKYIKRTVYFRYFNMNADYIKNLRKVVYTALLGKYDNVHPIVKENGYDYLMFTDQIFENKLNLNWTIVNIDEELKYLNINMIKRQRFFKTHPHFFLKNYDLSIYIDSTFEIQGKLDEFLLRILTPKLSIYVLEHPLRNTINNEFKEVLNCFKDSNKSVTFVKNKYKNENFPDNNGLAECCLIIRKHNEISSINFMNNWFEEIKLNSHRDQLSFNYILWKTGNSGIKYISKKYIEEYFTQDLNHLVTVTFKDNNAS